MIKNSKLNNLQMRRERVNVTGNTGNTPSRRYPCLRFVGIHVNWACNRFAHRLVVIGQRSERPLQRSYGYGFEGLSHRRFRRRYLTNGKGTHKGRIFRRIRANLQRCNTCRRIHLPLPPRTFSRRGRDHANSIRRWSSNGSRASRLTDILARSTFTRMSSGKYEI